jgi:hypothetical protein
MIYLRNAPETLVGSFCSRRQSGPASKPQAKKALSSLRTPNASSPKMSKLQSPTLKYGANKNAEKEFIALICVDYLDVVSDLRPPRNTLAGFEAKNLVSELPAKKLSNFFQLPV